jgi:hypothetical protein
MNGEPPACSARQQQCCCYDEVVATLAVYPVLSVSSETNSFRAMDGVIHVKIMSGSCQLKSIATVQIARGLAGAELLKVL